jgi:uncharacterized protein
MRDKLLRSLLWRRNDISSLEYCTLTEREGDFVLAGTVVTDVDGQPVRCIYEVFCSSTWLTRRVRVDLESGSECGSLELTADGTGNWWRDGAELASVRGLLDVDIAVSPSTNTLPIRRFGLASGQSAEVTAVWIRVPQLSLEPLPQQYTRTGEHSYRYASRGGAFTADLTVDELGLVVRYDRYWERVAST